MLSFTCKIIDGYIGNHIKEISNTSLLISLSHCYKEYASMEIYDIFQKEKACKIFSFENTTGSEYQLFELMLECSIHLIITQCIS